MWHQTEPESSSRAAAAVQSTRLAMATKPSYPAELCSIRGEIPAHTNTCPAFCLSNKVSSEEQRAFPSVFREHTSLQDWSPGLLAPIKCPGSSSPAPEDGEDTALAWRAPVGSWGGGWIPPSIIPNLDY